MQAHLKPLEQPQEVLQALILAFGAADEDQRKGLDRREVPALLALPTA